MKEKLLSIPILLLLCNYLNAQPLSITATENSTVVTNKVLIGMNGMNTIKTGEDWNSLPTNYTNFYATLADFNIAAARYPGGTVANWFKLFPGGFIDASDPMFSNSANLLSLCYGLPDFYNSASINVINELMGFRSAIDNTFISPVLVVNPLTSDLASQLAMLHEARIKHVPVVYVELGNELYVDKCENHAVYADGTAYATAMQTWITPIRQRFTDVEIAAVGATVNANDPPRRQSWNTQAQTVWGNAGTSTSPDAFTMHHYIGVGKLTNFSGGCNKIDGANDWPKLFNAPYKQFDTEVSTEITNNINNAVITTPYKMWFTEYNMKDRNYFSHGSWGHALFTGLETLLFLNLTNSNNETVARHVDLNNMLGNATASVLFNNDGLGFNFDDDDGESRCSECKSVATHPGTPTAEGIVFKEIATAMKNSVSYKKIDFTSASLPYLDGNANPAVVGYVFKDNAGNEQAIILNLSNSDLDITFDNSFANIGTANYLTCDFTQANGSDLNCFITGEPTAGSIEYFNIENNNACTTLNTINQPAFQNVVSSAITVNRWSVTRVAMDDITNLSAYSIETKACVDEPIHLVGVGNATTLTNLQWKLDGSIIAGATTANYEYTGTLTPGAHNFVLTNPTLSSANITVTVNAIPVFNVTDATNNIINGLTKSVCRPGSTYIMNALPSAGLEFTWVPSAAISGNFLASSATAAPVEHTVYTVYASDGVCSSKQNVTINIGIPEIKLGDNPRHICDANTFTQGQGTILSTGVDCNANTFSWFDGLNPTTNCTLAVPATVTNTTYTVTVTHNANCTASATIQVIADKECCPSLVSGNPALNIYITSPVDETSLANMVTAVCIGCVTSGPLTIDNTSGGIGNIYLFSPLNVTANNRLFFKSVNIIAAPGSEIKAGPFATVSLDATTVGTCGNKLWKGISTGKHTNIFVQNGSSLNDAEYAFDLGLDNKLRISGNTFNNNYISIYQPPPPVNTLPQGLVNSVIDARIYGNTFKSTGNLKAAYIGQTTTPATKPYAGMLVNDAVITIGVTGQTPNQFGDPANANNMNNGIIAHNSTGEVLNSKFNNLQNIDAYSISNGFGIASDATTPNRFSSLIQTGLGTGITSFNNCNIGIYAFNSSLTSSLNKITNTNTGYHADNNIATQITLHDNSISVFRFGMWLNNNEGADEIKIEHNYITHANYYSMIHGIECNDFFSPNALRKFNIHCNTLTGSLFSGITGNNMERMHVHSNTVIMQHPDGYYGMGLFGGTQVNWITANWASTTVWNPVAYLIQQSAFPVISDNLSSHAITGFDFQGTNTDAVFKTNTIGTHSRGVHLNSNGVIGKQPNPSTNQSNSNTWQPDPTQTVYGSGYGAVNDNNQGQFAIDQSLFTINNPTKGSASNPYDLVSNYPGYLWFNVNQLATNIPHEYGYDCFLLRPSDDDALTELDFRIVNDSVFAADFQPETRQTADGDLNDKLARNDSLRQSDTLYENYYNNRQSTATGQLSNVRMSIRTMNSVEPAIRKQIAANDTLIKYLMHSITVIDSTVYSSITYNDSISKETERATILLKISSLIQENNQLLASLQASQNNIAATASGINISINAATNIELNEKAFNEIYFDKILFRDFDFSSSQIITLHYIANQCPFVGGRVVYKARTVLKILGDTTVYDDAGVCAAIGIFRKANLKKESTLQNLIVSPNPSNSAATFYYQLPVNTDASIELLNPLGEKIEQISVPNNSFKFNHDFSKYTNGLYICRLISNSKTISTCKLSIVK